MSNHDFESHRREIRRDLIDARAVERLWAEDHALWQPEPDECADRLGWLQEPSAAIADAPSMIAWRTQLHANGVTAVVWCGMGGSSLFPELVARLPLPRTDPLAVHVLDTTHPASVARALSEHVPDSTLYVFASKSGGTIETRTHLDTFAEHAASGQFAVITDAGSELDHLARERGWRVWDANPRIGGRFSAMSRFGTAATALSGIDPSVVASAALEFGARCRADDDNPALELAEFLAAGARSGSDKLTVITPPPLRGMGAWIEQLVAESTGKHGVGILPVVDEPLGPPDHYGDDRSFVTYGDIAGIPAIRDAGFPVLDLGPVAAGAIGAELMRWMLATAWVGAALRINPFDQPDVESAKRAMLTALDTAGTSSPMGDPTALLDSLAPGDHIVVQAFVDPVSPIVDQLEAFRVRLRTKYRCAVTVGIGPRYLHSTGQLHKGGPNSGVFFQVVELPAADLSIPDRSFTFGELLRAQADGDYAALVHADRRVARVDAATLLALA
jgi:glucose-6-phosphate isomerase